MARFIQLSRTSQMLPALRLIRMQSTHRSQITLQRNIATQRKEENDKDDVYRKAHAQFDQDGNPTLPHDKTFQGDWEKDPAFRAEESYVKHRPDADGSQANNTSKFTGTSADAHFNAAKQYNPSNPHVKGLGEDGDHNPHPIRDGIKARMKDIDAFGVGTDGSTLTSGLKNMVDSASKTLGKVTQKVKRTAGVATEKMEENFGSAEELKHDAEAKAQRATQFAKGAANQAEEQLSDAKDAAKEKLSEAQDKARSMTQEAESTAKHYEHTAEAKAKDAAHEAKQTAENAKNTAQEYIPSQDEVTQQASNVAETAKSKAEEAEEYLKDKAHNLTSETTERSHSNDQKK